MRGFGRELDTTTVKSIIEKEINLHVIDIQSNRINNYNQSFKIDIDIADKERAFNPDQWFKGLVVKPFRPRRRFPPEERTDNYTRQQYHISQQLT